MSGVVSSKVKTRRDVEKNSPYPNNHHRDSLIGISSCESQECLRKARNATKKYSKHRSAIKRPAKLRRCKSGISQGPGGLSPQRTAAMSQEYMGLQYASIAWAKSPRR